MDLPKFLLADNSQNNPDRLYIVHTQKPRFIVGFDIDDFNTNQNTEWIDPQPSEKEITELMTLAEEFLTDELDNEEFLFDEDENNE
jgi:hypothetical protein